MISDYLTGRQRTAPPSDRMMPRRQESAGGVDVADPKTLAPGLETDLCRYPGTVYDGMIVRDRGAYYQQPVFIPPPITWISWTAAGPRRPELHGRNATWRNMGGNSATRFPVVDSPTTGMHTMGQAGTQRTMNRYVVTPQMVPARPDRLSPAVYAGQTYSQTTRLQGGRP
jgi:hypothetical protein